MTGVNLLRLFCFGFDGDAPPEYIRALLRRGLGGVILFKRNLRDLEQVCALTAEVHRQAGAPLLVGVDQEGGRVVRLPAPFLAPPAAAVLGAIDDPDLTRSVARAMGQELRAAGFTWNLAPVLDVHTNPGNPVIGDRAFSHEPDRVARMGLAAFRGFEDVGILTTGKHFPGHGETAADSHLTLPESPQTGGQVEDGGVCALSRGDPGRHPEHPGGTSRLPGPRSRPHPAVCPGSSSRTSCAPSSASTVWWSSDDLEMGAIVAGFDIGEAAVRFLEAGGDLDPDLPETPTGSTRPSPRWSPPSAPDVSRRVVCRPRSTDSHASPVVSRPTSIPLLSTRPRTIVGRADHRALLAAVAMATARLGAPPRTMDA